MKKICATCGKSFETASNRAIYCSDECRKIGATEKQKLLMRKKRKKEKEQKLEDYKKKKQELLENEKQFGYIGRTLIEGIDIHDPEFEKLIMEKIK
jgi:endogenous inhibitor of DNA gyrase (YacG/DUF329 family)